MAASFCDPALRSAWLSDARLRAALTRALQRRLGPADAEDVVQATLADALVSPHMPADAEDFRRFVFGIARNKLRDHYRRAQREVSDDAVTDFPESARDLLATQDLLRWAENELPEQDGAKKTLEWMLRESDGDKLEQIAEEAALPAPQVRQRVSRLRRYLRARWAAQLALLGVVALGVGWAVRAWLQSDEHPIARELPRVPTPRDRARELRQRAFERCSARDYRECLDELNRARDLDPDGEREPQVGSARSVAERALAPAPSERPNTPPTSSAPPMPSTVPSLSPTSMTPRAPRHPRTSSSDSALDSKPGESLAKTPPPFTGSEPPARKATPLDRLAPRKVLIDAK